MVLLIIFMERKYGVVKSPNKGPLNLARSSSYWLEMKATLHCRTEGLNSNTQTNELLQQSNREADPSPLQHSR